MKSSRLFCNKGHKRPGPKGPSQDLINAIVELKQRNPRYGCPRIAYLIGLSFGIEVSKDSLWSVDLFRCESLTIKPYWVLVVMDQWSRRIIGFGIHQGPADGIALCRMFNEANSDPPRSLSSDNDSLFRFHRWKANLRVLGVMEIKSVPYVPMSHPFIERVIGTIRREYLDQVPFWNSLDLTRKLDDFRRYYNDQRTHEALSGLTPTVFVQQSPKKFADLNNYAWNQFCRGLFQTPVPI